MEITKDSSTGTTKVTNYSYTPIYTVSEVETADGYRRVVRFYQDKDFLAAYRALYREAVQNENQEVSRPWQASALG